MKYYPQWKETTNTCKTCTTFKNQVANTKNSKVPFTWVSGDEKNCWDTNQISDVGGGVRVGDWAGYRANLEGDGGGYTVILVCQKGIFLKIRVSWLLLVSSNIIDFCIFILDPANLLNFAISINDYYVDNYIICEL